MDELEKIINEVDRFRKENNATNEIIHEDFLLKAIFHFLRWQKEQMMKDAKKLTVECNMFGVPLISTIANDCKNGDKVKVLIIKED